MGVGTSSWERALVSLACEGLKGRTRDDPLEADGHLLRRAYRRCEAITRAHSRTFYLASGLLPPVKRRAMRALYAFCRATDDLVDGSQGGDRRAALAEWRRLACDPNPPDDRLVALAWAHTRLQYRIPLAYAEQLLDGVARDLEHTRYCTFDDLATYCYGVASTVGLMAMHITGFSGPDAVPYAVKLGVALQLTNILRDVGEDWRSGRCYLPQDELARYGLGDDDLAAGCTGPRWQAFLTFQIERTRRLYAEALPGVALLHPDGRFAIAAAAELYCGILDDIEDHGGDVFRRRAYVTRREKLRRLPAIWWRAMTGAYARAQGRKDTGAPDGCVVDQEGGS